MEVSASSRSVEGSSASRRLRRAGKVPGIIYGANTQAVSIELDHNDLYHALRKEAFHSSILNMSLDGATQQVLLRDVQWHPYKRQVLHIDFQRVDANRKIHLKVPLHFVNHDTSPAVKLGGAIINHVLTELEVICQPADLPAFLEVDLNALNAGQSLHVSNIVLPKGVSLNIQGEDPVVVTALMPGGGSAAADDEPAAAPAAAEPAATPAKK